MLGGVKCQPCKFWTRHKEPAWQCAVSCRSITTQPPQEGSCCMCTEVLPCLLPCLSNQHSVVNGRGGRRREGLTQELRILSRERRHFRDEI